MARVYLSSTYDDLKEHREEKGPRVFISYARSDGETLASEIRERLEKEEPEIALWMDRTRMEGGVGWWKQISEAVDRVQFMVIVMTPCAIKSEITRKEWHLARQRGVCVCPVKGVPDSELDIESLPRWMSRVHFYDLEREWDTFVRYLNSPCHVPRAPFMAPDMPEGFVDRPREFGQLMRKLLDADRKDPIAITTALQGAGGFGKTTLAVALCHHEDVITAFDDGILWVTLGQNPNVQAGLTQLYAALTGEHRAFVTEEDAAFHLAQKLEDTSILIVIDDVWNEAHLAPFLRGGKGCARLITTRQPGVAVSAGAEPVSVDEMTQEESGWMLTKGLKTVPRDPAPFRRLAQRLGEWPLLLELANAALRQRVARGFSPEAAVEFLTLALDKRGVTAFDRSNPARRHQAISSTIDISLEPLTSANRERYLELSVFPEDTEVSHAAAESLWGLDRFDTEELLFQLDGLSLLNFDPKSQAFHLHNVMRSYLLGRLSDPHAVHGRLVDAWRDKHRLPDDYAWRWIGYHLSEAGREQELRELLFDFNWLRRKLQATDINALTNDFVWIQEAPLQLVRQTLIMSGHVLARDGTQLAGQLLGRLLGYEDKSEEIGLLLRSARKQDSSPWLRPLSSSLIQPSGVLMRLPLGHTHAVNAVVVSPDGKRAFSASSDKTLKVWDVESGKDLRTLAGHTHPVNCIAVSPDGKLALSGSSDQTVKVWDVVSGKALRSFKGHNAGVDSIALSPDGEHAVSASWCGTIKVWDVATGVELKTVARRAVGAKSIAVSADGTLALSASWDKTVKVWDVASKEELRTLEGHTGEVRCVAMSRDGKVAFSASSDKTVKVWDVESGEELKTFAKHTDWVNSVAVSPDGKLAFSVSYDRTSKVWDIETGEVVASFECDGNALSCAVAPDGRTFVAGDSTGRVHFLRLEGL